MTIGFKARLHNEKAHVRRRNLFEGTTKNILEGNEPGTFVLYFKDDHPLGKSDGAIREPLIGKGVINNRLSEMIFQRLGDLNIDHHLVCRLNMREQLVRIAEPVSFYVDVHNRSSDDFVLRFGYSKYHLLPEMITELRFKNKEAGDPVVGPQHLVSFGLSDHDELDQLFLTVQRVNDFLMGQFSALSMNLLRYKLEFGRVYMSENPLDTRLILIDEISLDTCRVIDAHTNKRMDVFCNRVGYDYTGNDSAVREFMLSQNVDECYDGVLGYHEIARRFGIINTAASDLSDESPAIVIDDHVCAENKDK